MDWSNEKYVRLFVRDTVTWKMLPWQSKLMLPAILRKLDRSGVLDLSGHGCDAIAAVTEVPIDFVESAMPSLLAAKVFTMDADRLTMPNYIPAQETRQSDAQRKRDSREKRAAGCDQSGQSVTSGHQQSPEVTLTPVLHQTNPDPQPDPRARVASSVPANEHGKPSARLVLTKFGAIRAEVCGGKAAFWQPSQTAVDKAAAWLADMHDDGVADVEPAIRLACEHVRDGLDGWNAVQMKDPAFLFGSFVSRWSCLREELHGCAPTVKPRIAQQTRESESSPILER